MMLGQKIETLLEEIGVALDITEAQFAEVEQRYKAVGQLLCKDNSILKEFNPDIMPQGSFLLGTMIRPIMEDDELDVDVVCRLRGKKSYWTQYHLKQEVGNQIKSDERYKNMLDEKGRRCWTLIYSGGTKFHLDILPSIVGQNHFTLLEKRYLDLNQENLDSLSLKITDNTLFNYKSDTNVENWFKSNPFGYAAWFNEKKKTLERRDLKLNESIKPLPIYQTYKEPLQRVVQILKRHRDIMFGGDIDKPISVIITTLSAQAYQGETGIEEALINVLGNMANYIQRRYSPELQKTIAWIENPVNAGENFADRWIDNPQREENFFAWLNKAQADFKALKNMDSADTYKTLKEVLGSRAVNEAYRNSGFSTLILEQRQYPEIALNLLVVPHRELPEWPTHPIYDLEIHGNYKDGHERVTITPNTYIPKNCEIFFVASTNAPRPFDVYWQVVNTGQEATSNGDLRGQIVHSKTLGIGGLKQKEISRYSGTHWVQCFIVKDGICVARSYEFRVNIN